MLSWELFEGEAWFVSAAEASTAPAARGPWPDSLHPSPFASPSVLALLAREATAAGDRPLAALGTDADGRPRALWPLVLRASQRLEFLQGRLCDHGSALYARDVPASSLAEGLGRVLIETAPASCYLANLPAWDATREAAQSALQAAGWSSRCFDALADPVLVEAAGPDHAERLAAHVRGKSLRNYANRLSKTEGYAFEVLGDASDLEAWVEDFCDAHEWRWARTPTPSEFVQASARLDFEQMLRAFCSDGSLFRFAIRVGERRIAMAVVLRAGDRLVYHRIAHSPGFDRSSAATVLIRNLVLWMAEHGETCLDFGLGDEDYKYRFATATEALARLYATPRRLSMTLFQASLESGIRSSPTLEGAWNRLVNVGLRGSLRDRAQAARVQFRRARSALHAGDRPAKWAPAIEDGSSWTTSGGSPSASEVLAQVPLSRFLATEDTIWPLSRHDRAFFHERQHAGWTPHAFEGDPRKSLWLRNLSGDKTGVCVRPRGRTSNATQQALLKAVCCQVGPAGRVYAQDSGSDGAGFSREALRGAGFEPSASTPTS